MNDWSIILDQARKLRDANAEWTSLGGRVKYEFVEVNDDRIVIDRLNGGERAVLGKKGVINAIKKLKESLRLSRSELMCLTVRQTTLVYLHPCVKWDKNKKEVFWDNKNATETTILENIEDANDDELVKIALMVNQRLNQSRFKKNMMRRYQEKCAISGSKVKETLEAAHIISHASS
jgi:hypothetical protein